MAETKPRYPEIDALKGLAMFLVILGHAVIWFPVNLHADPVCLKIFQLASSVHIHLFFFLSGLLFSYNGRYGPWLGKKALRLGVPFLIFNLLDMLPRALLTAFFRRPRPLSESLLSLVLNGGELWFLRALLIFYALFVPLALLQKRSILWKIMVEAALILVAVYPWRKPPWYADLDLDRLRLCLLFFNTGYLFRKPYPALRARLQAVPLPPKLIAALALAAIWVFSVFRIRLPGWQAWALVIVNALVAIAAFWLLTCWKPFLRFFERFGPWTLQLYLLNSWTMGASRYVVCTLLGVTAPAVILVCNMAVDFFLSYLLIKYVLSRFRILRFVMGVTAPPPPPLRAKTAPPDG